MTEAEWLACTDPQMMLEFLREKVSDRKLRLYGIECSRWWAHVLDERCLNALAAAERYADGRASRAEVMAEWKPVNEALGEYIVDHSPLGRLRESAASNVLETLELDNLADSAPEFAWPESEFWDDTFWLGSTLLRELVGNPLRPVALDPAWVAWNDCAVRKLTQAVYEERSFDRLPLLADALEEAGCNDADILAHCRSSGPHVRGCWVIDLLLGKE